MKKFLLLVVLAGSCFTSFAQVRYFVVNSNARLIQPIILNERAGALVSGDSFYVEALTPQEFNAGWGSIAREEQTSRVAAIKAAVEAERLAADLVLQGTKSNRQKNQERKVFTFLIGDALIPTNTVRLTIVELEGVYDAWDALSGTQGDNKASKFERLMRPLRLKGESEFTIYNHP